MDKDIKSKDCKADEAISLLDAISTVEELAAFMEGEERKTVINSAEERRKALTPSKPKQGEVKGPITQPADDFKAGVQREKAVDGLPITPHASRSYVTGHDIIDAIDKADRKKAEARAAEAQKADPAARREGVVTGEDVLKKMRAEGKKI